MTIELSARISAWWTVLNGKLRDERGISQTTEFLIILGAVALIAGVVMAFATGYVQGLMAKVTAP